MTQEEFRAKWGATLDAQTQGGAPTQPAQAQAPTAQQSSQQAVRQVRTRQAQAAAGASQADSPLLAPLQPAVGNLQLEQPPTAMPASSPSAEPSPPEPVAPWQGPENPNTFRGRIFQQSRDLYASMAPLGRMASQGAQLAGSAASTVLGAGDQLNARAKRKTP